MKEVAIRLSYPYLPVDSDRVRKARQSLQKTFRNEEIWAWLIYRRISIFVSLWLRDLLFITPNHITLLGIYVAVFGCGLLLLLQVPVHPGVLLLIYAIVYLCDCVDGEVARLRSQFHPLGKPLDDLLSITLTSFYAISTVMHARPNGLMGLYFFIVVVVIFRSAYERFVPGSGGDRSPFIAMRQIGNLFLSGTSYFVVLLILFPFSARLSALWSLANLIGIFVKPYIKSIIILRMKKQASK